MEKLVFPPVDDTSDTEYAIPDSYVTLLGGVILIRQLDWTGSLEFWHWSVPVPHMMLLFVTIIPETKTSLTVMSAVPTFRSRICMREGLVQL